jgi:hypothetical protein
MDTLIKSIVSVVALITGLLALGKGALDLWKEYRTNQTNLSALFSNRRFRIAFAIMTVGVLVLIGTLWWSTSRKNYVLTIQIWDIELDKKHSVIASKRFTGSTGNNVPDEIFQPAGTWVTEQIKQRYNLSLNEIKVHLHIPADLSREGLGIQTEPESPIELYYWIVEAPNKIRVPVDEQSLKNLDKDFYIEVAYPGYTSNIINVRWGQVFDQEFTLSQQSVAVGIEEFAGDNIGVSTWISDYLISNPRLSIKDPKTLEALEDEIKKEEAGIVNAPQIQGPIRNSLGLDLIISGNLEWK